MVWDALLKTTVDLGLTDDWQQMVDSTSVRSHVSAADGKRAFANALDRSRGGFTSKIQAHYDNQGLPLGFILTGSAASDFTAAEPLMDILVVLPKAMLADQSYDDHRFWESLLIKGILPIISLRPNRRVPKHPAYRRYRGATVSSAFSGSSGSSAVSPPATTRLSLASRAS